MQVPDYAKVALLRSSYSVVTDSGVSHLLLTHCLANCSDDEWMHTASNINDALTHTFKIDPTTFAEQSGFAGINLDDEQASIFDSLTGFNIPAIEVWSQNTRETAKNKYISLGQYSPSDLKTMDLFNHNFKFQIVENS